MKIHIEKLRTHSAINGRKLSNSSKTTNFSLKMINNGRKSMKKKGKMKMKMRIPNMFQ